MNEKPNYYSILPAVVRYDPDLTDKAKLIYSEITSLANKTGECWANNEYFMKLFAISESTIIRIIRQLKRKNYIDINYIYKENSKEIKQRIIQLIGSVKNDTTSCQNWQLGGVKNDGDNNKNNNNKKEIYKEKILTDNELSKNIKDILIEWLEYKKYAYEELGLKKLLTTIKKYLKEYTEEELIDVINESMASLYQGITFNKLKPKPKKANNTKPETINDDGVYRIL